MADVLKRLSGPAALTTSAATAYSPSGVSAVIRGIHVCNESGSDATFTLSIGTDGAGKRLFKGQLVAANEAFDWSGNVPLVASELVQALASANTALTLVLAGVET